MADGLPEITDPIDWDQLGNNVSTAFTPASPVSEDALFAGRIEQVRRVIDAINQPGQHAIIYGERGVRQNLRCEYPVVAIVFQGGQGGYRTTGQL